MSCLFCGRLKSLPWGKCSHIEIIVIRSLSPDRRWSLAARMALVAVFDINGYSVRTLQKNYLMVLQSRYCLLGLTICSVVDLN